MRTTIRALALVALCPLAALAGTGTAWADGDPASDILYAEQVFIPADAGIPSALQLQLVALVRAAGGHGYPIKVALVGSAADLGADTALWPQPSLYASFLGTELSLVYHGPLLIVMPDGLVLYHLGHSVSREQQILQRIVPAPGGSGLAEAALSGVQRLAAAAGHPLSLSHPSAPAAMQRAVGALPVAASVVAVLLIALAWGLSLWVRPLGSAPPARRSPPGGRARTRAG